jgi:hypothetical protein
VVCPVVVLTLDDFRRVILAGTSPTAKALYVANILWFMAYQTFLMSPVVPSASAAVICGTWAMAKVTLVASSDQPLIQAEGALFTAMMISFYSV